MDQKLHVLAQIGAKLNEAGVTWAVGASALLYLRGLADVFHDLDLMVTEDTVEQAKAVLEQLGTLEKSTEDFHYQTRHFFEYQVQGVEVDLMAGFVIVSQGQTFEAEFDKTHIDAHTMVDGVSLPLQKLSDWQTYYALMGRPGKAALIASGTPSI